VARARVGRQIAVELAQHVHRLPKTRRNGHFQAAVRIPVEELPEMPGRDSEESVLPLAVPGPGEEESAAGRAYLLPRTGLAVVSDIDDTLKHSHVACKRTLLTNTFLRP